MRRTVIRALTSLGIAGSLALGGVAPAYAATVTSLGTSGSTGGSTGGGLVPAPPAWPTGTKPCTVRADATDPNSAVLAIVPSGQQTIVQGLTGDSYVVTCQNGQGSIREFMPEAQTETGAS